MLDIVMPVYNGEKFLGEQIDSILRQDSGEWILYIRDDGSTDGTVEIVREYAFGYPDRIRMITDGKGNLGVMGNVLEILRYTENEFILFSDQDDVWFDCKISRMLKRMKKLQERCVGLPLLLHTDSVVTDEALHTVEGSFTRFAGLQRKRIDYVSLIRRSAVQAATMMVNRPLIRFSGVLYTEEEKNVMYHDWWFSLIAGMFGRIEYMREPLVYYRQHAGNLTGAGKAGNGAEDYFYPSLAFRYRMGLVNDRKRICLFLNNYKDRMTEEQAELLKYLRDEPNSWEKFRRFGMWRYYSGMHFLYFFLYGVISR